MACFTIPLVEGLAVTAVSLILANRKKSAADTVNESKELKSMDKISAIRKDLGNLQRMLFGGSFLLAIEHIYHGELTFVPPFLTAMQTAEEIPAMLRELATVGVGMAVLTTAVWGVVTFVSKLIKKAKSSAGAHAAAV